MRLLPDLIIIVIICLRVVILRPTRIRLLIRILLPTRIRLRIRLLIRMLMLFWLRLLSIVIIHFFAFFSELPTYTYICT